MLCVKGGWYLTTSKTSFTEDLVVNRTTMYILIFLGCVVPTACYQCWGFHRLVLRHIYCAQQSEGCKREYWVWFFKTTERCKYFFKHTSTLHLTGNICNCYTKALHNKIYVTKLLEVKKGAFETQSPGIVSLRFWLSYK